MQTANARRGRLARDDELKRATEAATGRYREYPNVVGVAASTKISAGTPTTLRCVQFLVSQKTNDASPRLPAYVCGRHPDGTVDRTCRFPTDVVEVGFPRFACGAGARVEGTGSRGTIAIFFRNKAKEDSGSFYLVTCAHVTGELDNSPPTEGWLASPACSPLELFAEVIKAGTRRGDSIEYDIALARVTDPARMHEGDERLDQFDARVVEAGIVLTEFFPEDAIRPSLRVECQLAESGTRSATVRSYAGTVLIEIKGRRCWIRNACLIDVRVRPGDSGGIVYTDSAAVGMIFARSSRGGLAWFHPLQSAMAYLDSMDPIFAVQCFS
jgi:hypothetical protein